MPKQLQLSTSFTANGESIYEINHANSTEGKIVKFPSPEELVESHYMKVVMNG